MNTKMQTRRIRRVATTIVAALVLLASNGQAATTIFQVTSFANPPWSVTYYGGFTGTVGVTPTWPAEMGWQGDEIDLAFTLGASVPGNAKQYRFQMVVPYRFTQAINLTISAGPSLSALQPVHNELVDSGRVINAIIPLSQFTPGQTNYIRIKGSGVLVGGGQPSGIQWSRWTLLRTDVNGTLESIRADQLQRLTNYVVAAIQPSGLVRDSLPLNPADAPFHPATPDAGGFALLGLCVADELGLLVDAEARTQAVLSAYAGATPGVSPLRNTKGHWWHWLDINTGGTVSGWNDNYTTIGSALLVSGALFAKNHFIQNATIGALADQLRNTTDFDAMIHPSLDGRVYLATDAAGNAIGTLGPWNEYMLIVSLARNQAGATRGPAVAPLWLNPATSPQATYQGNATITDHAGTFAPAFWVHQQYYFNADFSSNSAFLAYFHSHQRADALYCAWQRAQTYRHGLTAGVSPAGYTADSISNYQGVLSPEAVLAWGDLDALLDFAADQPPTSNVRFRYGLTRVSAPQPSWIPFDAGLVDHTFLMFGLMESIEPLFFKQRQAFQTDSDADGIANAYDNCPTSWNPLQSDGDDDGIGDACDCATPFADHDGDGDADMLDFAGWQLCPTGSGWMDEGCLCMDRNHNHVLDAADLGAILNCMGSSGPDVPADPGCGP